MKKIDFNQDWLFVKKGAAAVPVHLPHDAMLHEKRDPACLNGRSTGYFPGGKYVYTKNFIVPDEWADKSVFLEFEGVYHNAVVSVNGKEAARHPYGYTNFAVELGEFLDFGGKNVVEVIADTSGEPNTRWYSGAGIYRPVWLYVGEKKHIDIDGVQITTLSHDPAVIRVKTLATGGNAQIEVYNNNKLVAVASGNDVQIMVPDAELWSADNPKLYDCRVLLQNDGQIVEEQSVHFGICHLEWNTKGLFINGQETKLRGACIHHDNGILGACEYPAAAQRRVRILKEAGFNAIRSAHNPISRALLEACDKLGLYVMDELCDMWYEHKNRYDYATWFDEWHTADLTAMIQKDISHPSVIMYSIGNEVTETAEPGGIALTKEMTDLCHNLDDTRPVTCGINMALNVMHFAGLGVYKPAPGEKVRPPEAKNPRALAVLGKMMEARKAQAAKSVGQQGQADTGAAGTAALGMQADAGARQDGKLVGSEYFNKMMVTMKEQQQAVVKQEIAKILSEDAYAALDIAGYNYAITRYELDAQDYPDRISVGTETLPQKIYQNWQHVMACPYSVGDFIWTGWDYIGEAGVGIFCYDSIGEKDGAYPDLLAGSGIIDILGHERPEVGLNRAVYGLTDSPTIGVEPLTHAEENHIISAWRFSDAVRSWSWEGCEGCKAEIIVYSGGESVRLFQNGILLGEEKLEECQAKFHTVYRPGTLVAVSYDKNGNELGRDELQSASGTTRLNLIPDKLQLKADGQDLCYLDISLTGEDGIRKASADLELTLTVTGAGTLAGFGNAAPCMEESYTDNIHTTYYGRALAVLRAGTVAGKIQVTVSAPECDTVTVELDVE